MSIRAQLAALALLVALPLVALVAYRIYAEFRDDAARAADSVQRVARAAASDTRRALDETERVLKRLAQRPAVRAMSAQQCDPAIEEFRAAVAGYANIITIESMQIEEDLAKRVTRLVSLGVELEESTAR